MTAAAARKLQKDIDVVLKKVDDGIEEFENVWEQATGANNNAQKEKLGEELKRSINKLQRLRAQIREWIAQSDMKNSPKEKLEDARRRIENDMQRFKEFERDLKTKAFSTCALAKDDELELEEAEKIKYQEWLSATIQGLNDQQDEFDADLLVIAAKKSLSSEEKSSREELKGCQDRHLWHINKLELILRALDNDAIDMSDLAVTRESVELFVENHRDPDWPHDEQLYDCFDLTEFEEQRARAMKSAEALTPKGEDKSKEEPTKRKEKDKRKKDEKKDRRKEERERKAAGASASGTPKAGKGPSTPGGAPASPHEGRTEPEKPKRLLDDINLDEEKVTEDQLLSEAEEFICKICQVHVVGCSPKLTNCSHLFCGDCIAQWFNQHPESQSWAQRARSVGPDRVVPCPVCKQPLNEAHDLYPVCGATSRSENLLLWRMLSSLKIMCSNHSKMLPNGTCDWIGEYGQYQKHLASCKSAPICIPVPVDEVLRIEGAGSEARGDSPRTASLRDGAAGSSSRSSSHSQSTPAPERSKSPATKGKDKKGAKDKKGDLSAPTTPTAVSAAEESRSAAEAATAEADAKQQAKQAAQAQKQQQAQQAQQLKEQQAQQLREEQAQQLREQQAQQLREQQAQQLREQQAQQLREQQAQQLREQQAQQLRERQAQQLKDQQQKEQQQKEQQQKEQQLKEQQQKEQQQKEQQQKAQQQKAQQQAQQAQQQAQVAQPKEDIRIATSTFEPTGPNMVTVQSGQSVQILELHGSGWTYCRNVETNSTGWAPSWIVQPSAEPKQEEAAAPAAAPAAPPAPKTRVQEAPAKESGRTQVASAPTPQHATQQAAAQPAQPAPQQAAQAAPAASLKAPQIVVRAATTSFQATTSSQLGLATNDLVEIVERHSSGWTYGRKVSPNTEQAEGWFPDWVCAQK